MPLLFHKPKNPTYTYFCGYVTQPVEPAHLHPGDGHERVGGEVGEADNGGEADGEGQRPRGQPRYVLPQRVVAGVHHEGVDQQHVGQRGVQRMEAQLPCHTHVTSAGGNSIIACAVGWLRVSWS